MALLAPVLLVALSAIAVPILVHLVQRERKTVVPFPSLMFLRRIPHQSVRRRAIRHWPLLALRILAVALIVLAFARPYQRRLEGAAIFSGGAREVVILLDRSFSMGYSGHWDQAREAARRMVRGLGPGDLGTVIFFGRQAEIGPRSSPDRAALLHAIDAAVPGPSGTRYGPALRAAAGVLDASKLGRREVVLISDFQKSGWDRTEDSRLPPGVSLTALPVGDQTSANAALAGLSFDRTGAPGAERVTTSARIVNYAAAPVSDREVTLEVDGIRVDSRRVSIGARAAATVTFSPFTLAGPSARVRARLSPDNLSADDTSCAVVRSGDPLKVLIVESSNPAPESSLYLVRALSVGAAPAFDTTVTRVDRTTASDIASADAVILNDSRPPPGGAGRALDARVRGGTGLLVALGERSAWTADDPDLLPGRIGEAVDRSGSRGATLGYVDYSHPVFETFSAPRSGDLTAPHVFRYRRLASAASIVARFDDGATAVAERRVGQGTVMVWTSAFDSYWNDFALTPVFVPFVHQAIKYLARYVEPRLWHVVGDAFDPAELLAKAAGGGSSDQPEPALFAPDGRPAPVSPSGSIRGTTLSEPGFYELRPALAARGNPGWVAVNLDPSESDLDSFDPADLVKTVSSSGTVSGQGTAHELTDEERERSQAWWWYLLIGGFLLLFVEVVVAGRLPRIA